MHIDVFWGWPWVFVPCVPCGAPRSSDSVVSFEAIFNMKPLWPGTEPRPQPPLPGCCWVYRCKAHARQKFGWTVSQDSITEFSTSNQRSEMFRLWSGSDQVWPGFCLSSFCCRGSWFLLFNFFFLNYSLCVSSVWDLGVSLVAQVGLSRFVGSVA